MYKIYFQIYGKKMKVSIEANSEEEVKGKVRSAIRFDKIVKEKDAVDYLMDIFKIKR